MLEILVSFNSYKGMDSEARQKFKASAYWLDRFDEANPSFDEYTTVPELDSFINENKAEIDQILNISSVVDKVMNEFIRPAHESLIATLNKVNIDELTNKIVMREKSTEEIFDTINEKIGTQFSQLDERINKTYQMLDKLGRSALILNQKGNPLQGRQNLSTVSNTLAFYIDYHTRALNILGYYEMVLAEIKRLNNILKDS